VGEVGVALGSRRIGVAFGGGRQRRPEARLEEQPGFAQGSLGEAFGRRGAEDDRVDLAGFFVEFQFAGPRCDGWLAPLPSSGAVVSAIDVEDVHAIS
jgi:hypothetical protein